MYASPYTQRRPVHCVVVKARPPCVGGRDTWQTRSEDVAARSILSSRRRCRRRRRRLRRYCSSLFRPRSPVHSSQPFNSHEMNIDWQVPRVGARGGVTARVVVVFCCCSRHRVTTPVTVVRGVGSIMSPRNFPSSSSACRLSAVVAKAAAVGVVVVRLRHGVSR